MESMIRFGFVILILSFNLFAKDEEVGRLYYKNFLGHVHENPSKDSTSKTVVQCSHSVKLLSSKNKIDGWVYVEVGEDKGYIEEKHLVVKRPDCLQQKYPKFYNQLDLNLSEMYFWGRLYDHYFEVETRIK